MLNIILYIIIIIIILLYFDYSLNTYLNQFYNRNIYKEDLFYY